MLLGHRPLSFLDLSDRTQPMASMDGQIVVAFNDEIYQLRHCARNWKLWACASERTPIPKRFCNLYARDGTAMVHRAAACARHRG